MAESQMVINYVPGEECRVAIVEDGKLEEYYVERFASASRVGNIYVGRVTNVEPAIQAAFVDFGVEDNGFLHVSDLHPRYFPGEDQETTERVGLKTPRRERPPIQACLRKGDEVIVQVLKEGVGTKGPTLTSYLSIPGRFLVMMPYMERSGVSRKVEDEEQRRQMREILDQLELPEGFGFIVRTAGMERNKTELKRDLAYLQRLWKDMERRLKAGGKARLLYSESDLLVRSLRDLLTTEIKEVVIDHEVALKRAARFMKIVAPRGQAKLLHWPHKTPIFHALGVERQIALIHAREVPLPSGGRLVIDQTEALVAIDVNSGRSRESRDSETNAYQTNIEAVDEICRQLRLRDLGGIVINDLIDMRSAQHRKDIEHRFKERLKRDRARSTVLSISEFGILEMTRQRMRASHESVHFADCPTCRGRGVVQKPDSIAGDALRELSAILDVERVVKVEMVVAPRVAGELLSTKRQALGRVERHLGKHVDVRVSETMPLDRVDYYAYDAQGADIDVKDLPRPKKPRDLVAWEYVPEGDEGWTIDEDQERSLGQTPEEPAEAVDDTPLHPIEIDEPFTDDSPEGAPGEGSGERKRRRRRRGRGRGGRADADGRPDQRSTPPRSVVEHKPSSPEGEQPAVPTLARFGDASGASFAGDHGEEGESVPLATGQRVVTEPIEGSDHGRAPQSGSGTNAGEPAQGEGERRRRRRRRGRGGRGRGEGARGDAPRAEGEASAGSPAEPAADGPGVDGEDQPARGEGEGEGGRRRRRRRRGRGGRGGEGGGPGGGQGGGPGGASNGAREGSGNGRAPAEASRPPAPAPSAPTPAPANKPRTLYSAIKRKLSPADLNRRPKPE